jgi:hypothetical protein
MLEAVVWARVAELGMGGGKGGQDSGAFRLGLRILDFVLRAVDPLKSSAQCIE